MKRDRCASVRDRRALYRESAATWSQPSNQGHEPRWKARDNLHLRSLAWKLEVEIWRLLQGCCIADMCDCLWSALERS